MAQVTSEITRLKQVLVHEPGPEVDRMVPEMMEELLFDDIIFGDEARNEHAIFRGVMETLGIEILESRDLLQDVLENPEATSWLLDILVGSPAGNLKTRMESMPPKDLANMLITGLRHHPEQGDLDADSLFEISPVPNWCFQRDPQVILGNGVMFSAMATPARWRETLLTRTIFRYHPRLSSVPVILDPLQPQTARLLFMGLKSPHFEGGDFLVLGKDVVAIGLSERTNRAGVQLVAKSLSRLDDGPRWLIVVDLPRRRSYMHLDTVFNPVDHNSCLAHAPVMLPGGSEEAAIFEIDLKDKNLEPIPRGSFLATLKNRGIDYEPIPCGGPDPVAQQREQWTDGSNTLALAPGVVTLYERNVQTTHELSRHGFSVVNAKDVIDKTVKIDLDHPKRTCILLPSHEISRARGGPHCLSHPLERE